VKLFPELIMMVSLKPERKTFWMVSYREMER